MEKNPSQSCSLHMHKTQTNTCLLSSIPTTLTFFNIFLFHMHYLTIGITCMPLHQPLQLKLSSKFCNNIEVNNQNYQSNLKNQRLR